MREGNEEAARHLWDRYFAKITEIARQRLAHAPRRIADEEDVALSVFDTLCRGVAAGRFTKCNRSQAKLTFFGNWLFFKYV